MNSECVRLPWCDPGVIPVNANGAESGTWPIEQFLLGRTRRNWAYTKSCPDCLISSIPPLPFTELWRPMGEITMAADPSALTIYLYAVAEAPLRCPFRGTLEAGEQGN